MGLSKLKGLYREVILDYANPPHNKGKLTNSTNAMTLHNPTCGDTINLQIEVANGKVKDIAYTGDGCTISQASASMMTDAVKGKTTEEALEMAKIFSDMAINKQHSEEDLEKLGDARILTSIMEFPAQIKCATLSWWALQRSLLKDDKEESNNE